MTSTPGRACGPLKAPLLVPTPAAALKAWSAWLLPRRRVKAIKAMLPTAEGLYEMTGCGAARGPLSRFQAAVAGRGWQ